MLTLYNVEVIYSAAILVLRGVSLEVPEAGIVALMGANGAGKTTTLKAISGLLKAEVGKVTRGRILLDAEHIENGDPEKIAGRGVIQCLEGRRVFEHLTAEDNIMSGAYLRSDRRNLKRDVEELYGYFPGLKELRSNIAGYLSGGEQQQLVVARALMARPRVLLLDEPSLGLAPLLVKELFGIIGRINKDRELSILLVEQNAKAALNLAHHGYVMENGRVVLDGPADKLKENEDVQEFYLGLSQVGQRKSYREVKHYKRRKRWLG